MVTPAEIAALKEKILACLSVDSSSDEYHYQVALFSSSLAHHALSNDKEPLPQDVRWRLATKTQPIRQVTRQIEAACPAIFNREQSLTLEALLLELYKSGETDESKQIHKVLFSEPAARYLNQFLNSPHALHTLTAKWLAIAKSTDAHTFAVHARRDFDNARAENNQGLWRFWLYTFDRPKSSKEITLEKLEAWHQALTQQSDADTLKWWRERLMKHRFYDKLLFYKQDIKLHPHDQTYQSPHGEVRTYRHPLKVLVGNHTHRYISQHRDLLTKLDPVTRCRIKLGSNDKPDFSPEEKMLYDDLLEKLNFCVEMGEFACIDIKLEMLNTQIHHHTEQLENPDLSEVEKNQSKMIISSLNLQQIELIDTQLATHPGAAHLTKSALLFARSFLYPKGIIPKPNRHAMFQYSSEEDRLFLKDAVLKLRCEAMALIDFTRKNESKLACVIDNAKHHSRFMFPFGASSRTAAAVYKERCRENPELKEILNYRTKPQCRIGL